MAVFTSADVARLGDLARIALTEDETAKFASDLSQIAEAMAKLSDVAADVPPTSHPIPLTNVWREDEVGGDQLDLDEVLASAPAQEDSKFAVPQILGEDA